MSTQLLLVEDDDSIAIPLQRALLREGYGVTRVDTGEAALERHRIGDLSLVVLDLGLPDIDGLEVCRRIRERDPDVAVLMLTARGDELDRVVGLDVGADDYLAKPFGLAELLARLRAALRRHGASGTPVTDEPDAPTGPEGPFRVDAAARRVFVGDDELQLTVKEFDLLAMLHDRPGQVVRREDLMDEVWDANWFGSTKTLDVTVARLRQKLVDAAAPASIATVRGVGFRLESGD